MTKELSIRCDASTVQGTSEANHDTYGYFFDSPNRRTLLWVIDGATPLEKEKYPNALYHIVRQLSKTLEHTFGQYAERFERVGLQQALTEAIARMRDVVAVLAPTHGIRPRPSLMEGDNYDTPDACHKFWTEFGTFSITMIDLNNGQPVITECLQLGDCGLLVDDMYCSDRRVHKFRSIIDHEVETADTALAAQQLANGTLPKTTAVLCSEQAAQLYDLQIEFYQLGAMYEDEFGTRQPNETEFRMIYLDKSKEALLEEEHLEYCQIPNEVVDDVVRQYSQDNPTKMTISWGAIRRRLEQMKDLHIGPGPIGVYDRTLRRYTVVDEHQNQNSTVFLIPEVVNCCE